VLLQGGDEGGPISHRIDHARAAGPFDLAGPGPVTKGDFTALLSKALSRRAVLTVPKFMLRTALGGFADEALLASQRLSPVKLLDSGYRFLSTDLLAALKVMLAA